MEFDLYDPGPHYYGQYRFLPNLQNVPSFYCVYFSTSAIHYEKKYITIPVIPLLPSFINC